MEKVSICAVWQIPLLLLTSKNCTLVHKSSFIHCFIVSFSSSVHLTSRERVCSGLTVILNWTVCVCAQRDTRRVVILHYSSVEAEETASGRDGSWVFHITTPLLTYSLRAKHKVAMQEWIYAIENNKLGKTAPKQGYNINIYIYTLNSLHFIYMRI